MLFPTLPFLFFFLPLTIGAYYLSPRPLRNFVLLASSLLFYTWGSSYVLLLLASIAVNFTTGALVSWAVTEQRYAWKRSGIAASVALNLGILGYLKYGGFAVEQLNTLGSQLGAEAIGWHSVVLPLGISFFTFQSMSYTLDIARGRVEPIRNPIDYALYVALFPQLIAGPIVRFHEIADQLRNRTTSSELRSAGAIRFSHGLVKKVVVADAVGQIAEVAFDIPPLQLTTTAAWIGVIAYTLQIYFDFSAYSDMAIGLGQVFGFRLPENFARPYSALSMTDFWRRWHMTLSSWFRDYLYVSLGGSRVPPARLYRNLVIVFLATGLWHGAQWTFVFWGAYHGALLIAERVAGQRPVANASFASLRRWVVCFLVIFGWVIFRSDSLASAGEFYRAMFSFDFGQVPELSRAITGRNGLVLILATGVFFLPRSFSGARLVTESTHLGGKLARGALLLLGLPYSIALVASDSFSPFLYFQF
jgi:alginate O-acetyltransferase complex protein AlgI